MEKYFALIKNSLVESVVVATDSFLDHIEGRYDFVIDVTNSKRPTVGDSYYEDLNLFVSNTDEIHNIMTNPNQRHLKCGTENGFEPFKISKYTVKYENGMIVIGCKAYSAPGFLDALHRVLVEKEKTTSHFTTVNGNPCHGRFDITWEDAHKLHEALKKVRF